MQKQFVFLSGLFIMLSIILGAMGAHALKKYLNINELNSFETGVKYQMYHALFLLFISQTNTVSEKIKEILFKLILIGTLLFSGSIYLLSTSSVTHLNFKPIGFITPIGGLLLISAWFVLFLNLLKKKV